MVGPGFLDEEQQVQSQEMQMCTVCSGAARIGSGSSSGNESGGFAAGPRVKRMEGFRVGLEL